MTFIETLAIITLDDFKNYEARTNVSVTTSLLTRGNLTLNSFSLPGSGDILALILKVMEKYDDLYPKAGKTVEKSLLFYHRLIETFKYAYSQRTLLEDSADINKVNLLQSQFTSDSFAEYIKNSIDETKTFPIESGKYGTTIRINEDKGTAQAQHFDELHCIYLDKRLA